VPGEFVGRVPGPEERQDMLGGTFAVTGVSIYKRGFRVDWNLSGVRLEELALVKETDSSSADSSVIPEPMRSALDRSRAMGRALGRWVEEIVVEDDLGSRYSCTGWSIGGAGPIDGSFQCEPAPSPAVRTLRVLVHGATLVCRLR